MIFGWIRGFANLLSLHSRIGGIARGRSLSILHFNIEVGRTMIVAFLVLSVYETVFAPLAAIDLTEAEGAWVRSLVKWAEEGETSSRYFFAIGEGAWSWQRQFLFFLFLLSVVGLRAQLNFVGLPGCGCLPVHRALPSWAHLGEHSNLYYLLFFITVHWSLWKQQHLDSVIIIKVSYFASPFTFWSLSVTAVLNFLGLLWPCLLGRQATCAFSSYRIDWCSPPIGVFDSGAFCGFNNSSHSVFFVTDALVTLVHRLLKLRSCNMSQLFWVGKVVLSGGLLPSSESSGLLSFWGGWLRSRGYLGFLWRCGEHTLSSLGALSLWRCTYMSGHIPCNRSVGDSRVKVVYGGAWHVRVRDIVLRFAVSVASTLSAIVWSICLVIVPEDILRFRGMCLAPWGAIANPVRLPSDLLCLHLLFLWVLLSPLPLNRPLLPNSLLRDSLCLPALQGRLEG